MKKEQTPYEKAQNLRPRAELSKDIMSLIEELSDEEFHDIYSVVWRMTAVRMLAKFGKEREEKQAQEIKELKAKIKKMEVAQ